MSGIGYIPALRYAWLSRLYDPVVSLTCRERKFRERLLALSEVRPGDQVLDLACGTGTFAVMLRQNRPGAHVHGLDADPAILQRARAKAAQAGAEIQFAEGLSFEMPYPEDTFDTVFSSLFFHHLRTEQKRRTLAEIQRVLKPGGALWVCDWGPASGPFTRLAFTAVRMLDGFEVTRDNVAGRLPDLIAQAGFGRVRRVGQLVTALGMLQFLSAKATGADERAFEQQG